MGRDDKPGQPLFIGPAQASDALGAIGDTLLQIVLQAALGSDAAGVAIIPSHNRLFDQSYLVSARHAVLADRLLTRSVQEQLLAWRGKQPLITRTSQGLAIEFPEGATVGNRTSSGSSGDKDEQASRYGEYVISLP